jgi:hypothetical protein
MLFQPGHSMATHLHDFGELYRVRIKLNACREPIIPGRFGHIYLRQVGDFEAMLFDPEVDVQARLAIRLAGVKRRKNASPAQLANLRRDPGAESPQRLENASAPIQGLRHPETEESTDGAALSETSVSSSKGPGPTAAEGVSRSGDRETDHGDANDGYY